MSGDLPAELPLAVIDVRDGVIVAVNDAAVALFDRSEADLLGQPVTTLAAPDDHEVLHALASSTTFRGPHDPPCWIEILATWPATRDADDTTTAVVLRDATEAVRTKRVMHELIMSASVVGDHGQRLWGPIGRETPMDGTELPGSVVDRIHPEDLGRVLDLYTQILAQPGARASTDVRVQDPQLTGRWSDATIQISDCRTIPEVGGILVSTEHAPNTNGTTSLGRTDSSLVSIAEAAPVGIILTGPAGVAVFFNEAVQRLLPGIGPGVLERDWTRDARDSDRDDLRAMLHRVVSTRDPESSVVCFDVSGTERWLLVTIAPRIVEADRLIGNVITLQDVTAEVVVRQQLEAAQDRLIHLATHDALTGLANRLLLADHLAERLATSTSSVGLLFCDLDGFKAVNDALGHALGDKLLAEVAARLLAVVHDRDTLARFGGDEFIIVAERRGVDVLTDLAVRAVSAVSEPYRIDGEQIRIGMSVGISLAAPGDTADEVLRRADDAMYVAKASDEHHVHVHTQVHSSAPAATDDPG